MFSITNTEDLYGKYKKMSFAERLGFIYFIQTYLLLEKNQQTFAFISMLIVNCNKLKPVDPEELILYFAQFEESMSWKAEIDIIKSSNGSLQQKGKLIYTCFNSVHSH